VRRARRKVFNSALGRGGGGEKKLFFHRTKNSGAAADLASPGKYNGGASFIISGFLARNNKQVSREAVFSDIVNRFFSRVSANLCIFTASEKTKANVGSLMYVEIPLVEF
jgi:hypothetical protein